MKAYTYIEKGRFELLDKPKPEILDPKDAIVRVTLSSICSSDLHIKHGSIPRAVPGVTVGHEMVGVVEEVGAERVVVFGDNVNDLPMMQEATHAVAVGNAIEQVRQAADEVIGCNTDDCVAEWILRDITGTQ
jgi:threonine dehydrogenase-like Zn-dependent dehydrogenase